MAEEYKPLDTSGNYVFKLRLSPEETLNANTTGTMRLFAAFEDTLNGGNYVRLSQAVGKEYDTKRATLAATPTWTAEHQATISTASFPPHC